MSHAFSRFITQEDETWLDEPGPDLDNVVTLFPADPVAEREARLTPSQASFERMMERQGRRRRKAQERQQERQEERQAGQAETLAEALVAEACLQATLGADQVDLRDQLTSLLRNQSWVWSDNEADADALVTMALARDEDEVLTRDLLTQAMGQARETLAQVNREIEGSARTVAVREVGSRDGIEQLIDIIRGGEHVRAARVEPELQEVVDRLLASMNGSRDPRDAPHAGLDELARHVGPTAPTMQIATALEAAGMTPAEVADLLTFAVKPASRKRENPLPGWPLPVIDRAAEGLQEVRIMRSLGSGRPFLHGRFVKVRQTKGGPMIEEKWTPICSPVQVVGELIMPEEHDEAGGAGDLEQHILLKGLTNGGGQVEVTLPKADLANPRRLAETLTSRGIAFHDIKDGPVLLASILTQAVAAHRVREYRKPGWKRLEVEEGEEVLFFLGLDGQVITRDGDEERLPPLRLMQRKSSTITPRSRIRRGDLAGWQAAMRDLADLATEGAPHWVVASCAGFAGPVLEFLDDPMNMGFTLIGDSGNGKSVAQAAQTSVWAPAAISEKGLFRGAPNNENGVEVPAELANNLTLAIDELGTAPDPAAIAGMIFRLANGSGKDRLMRTARDLQQGRSWRTFVTMSSEISTEARLAGIKKGGTNGISARLPSVDTDYRTSKNIDSIRIDDARARLGQNCGNAGPEFVRWLLSTEAWVDVNEMVSREIVAFADLAERILGGQLNNRGNVNRIARPFAVAKVAGLLAARAGVLPLTEEEIGAAFAWAFESNLRSGNSGRLVSSSGDLKERLLLWIATHEREHIHRLANPRDVENPQREAHGWVGDGVLYLPTSRLGEILADVTPTKFARDLGDVLMRRGERDVTHPYMPVIGRIRHYRIDLGRLRGNEPPVPEPEEEAGARNAPPAAFLEELEDHELTP